MATKVDKPVAKPTDKDVLDPNHPFNDADPDNPNDGIDPDTGKKVTAKAGDGPKRVKIKVGDNELETDEASGAAITALMKQNSDLYAYLKSIQTTPAKKEEPKEKAKDYDWDTELFVNPKEALARLRSEIKAEVKAEMTEAYNGAETEKEFWRTFYKQHESLKEHDTFVKAILQRDYKKIADLPASEAAEKLAEAVKREILKMTGGKSHSDADDRPLEGGSTRANAKPSGQKGEDVIPSIGELIRQRQRRMREATFHKEK